MAYLLYPPGYLPAEGSLPPLTVEDLQLERMAECMSPSHYYKVTPQELNALLSTDPEVLRYRQAVMAELLEQPALEGAMERLLGAIDGWESRSGGIRRGLDSFAVGLNLEDFSWLEGCLQKIGNACSDFEALPLRSAGLRALAESLREIRYSAQFQSVEADFRALCAGHVSPSKLRLGYNLDKSLKPSRLKLLRMEAYAGDLEKGKGKKSAPENRRLTLTQRALEMDAMLLQKAVSSASQSISGFVMRVTGPLRSLKKELIFYLAGLKLCRSWQAMGLPHCFPTLCDMEERAFEAEGLFSPLLVAGGREKVVCNDIAFAPGGELIILTGANQGGKTVFLLSVGLAQWLAQLGLMVPAARATVSPAENILTVFAPNSTQRTSRGLLAEEAGRIAAAVGQVSKYSMVLFNEPLTSTGPEETRSISGEVLAVFKAAGVRGLWVTHVFELAAKRHLLEEAIPWGSAMGSLRILLQETEAGSESTYRVLRGEPDLDTPAYDALRRGGVTL